VARPATDPRLSPSTGYELAQIVGEALRNATRHGHATQAVVKIAARPTHLYLVVRDNGSGFPNGQDNVDPDGFLNPAAAPWSIRERTAAVGGSLSIWTKPGRGAEIAITIPAGNRTGRHGSERRMQA
jgi:signal transduction histidine kinase